ncbi:hypothetical protein NDU88_004002 [Pleurodeles waltl]|uniref:Succinate dehydrogenase assembly factor 4, mitochondrial n=1 Tax=Pleurodeles waltl TaxID=8319 RepID=A0AAV7NLH0_PLEWA|nr:hypothetical protein NDU88_004002 [Pleurodeles waltl]
MTLEVGAAATVGARVDGAHWSRAALEVRKVSRLTSRLLLRGMSGGTGGRGSTGEETAASPQNQQFFAATTMGVPPVRGRQFSAPQKDKKKNLEPAENKRYGDSGGEGEDWEIGQVRFEDIC